MYYGHPAMKPVFEEFNPVAAYASFRLMNGLLLNLFVYLCLTEVKCLNICVPTGNVVQIIKYGTGWMNLEIH